MPRATAVPSVRPIHFARSKYGVPLAVDAAEVRDLPGFIQTDEPHALTFYELMLVRSGRGALDVDGTSAEVRPAAAFLTRPGQVRRWRLRLPLAASVLFFEREFVDGFFRDVSFLDELDEVAPDVRLGDLAFERARVLLCESIREIARLRADSDHVLRASLYHLLAIFRRHAARDTATQAGATSLSHDFSRVVERHFRDRQRVADYARLLGVSAEHLSRVVRRETGHTASDFIHRRVLLEAQRMLRYTDASVAAIAEALDFADASYLVRFFKRHAGTTPGAYRKSHSAS